MTLSKNTPAWLTIVLFVQTFALAHPDHPTEFLGDFLGTGAVAKAVGYTEFNELRSTDSSFTDYGGRQGIGAFTSAGAITSGATYNQWDHGDWRISTSAFNGCVLSGRNNCDSDSAAAIVAWRSFENVSDQPVVVQMSTFADEITIERDGVLSIFAFDSEVFFSYLNSNESNLEAAFYSTGLSISSDVLSLSSTHNRVAALSGRLSSGLSDFSLGPRAKFTLVVVASAKANVSFSPDYSSAELNTTKNPFGNPALVELDSYTLEIASPVIGFEDSSLKAQILAHLGLPTGAELTEEDLLPLTDLILANRVTSLSGLEHAINLERIVTTNSSYLDLSPLSALNSLRHIELFIADIESFTDLSNLSGLESIVIRNANGSSFAPFAAFPNLLELTVTGWGGVYMIDSSSISSLSKLKVLSMRRYAPNDFSVLSNMADLEVIDLDYSYGSLLADSVNLEDLRDLDQLRVLNIPWSAVSDFSALTSLPNLEELNVNGWNFGNSLVSEVISNLPGLKVFKASGDALAETESLASLTKLEIVDLSYLSLLEGGELSDISFMVNMNNLKEVDLSQNNILSIASLSGKTQLRYLNLHSNRIESIDPLEGLNLLTDYYDSDVERFLPGLRIDRNYISVNEGSPDLSLIETLKIENDAKVVWQPQYNQGFLGLPDTVFSGSLLEITQGSGLLVALGSEEAYWSGDDGVTWNEAVINGSLPSSLITVEHGDGTFVAAGFDGAYMRSDDGETWTVESNAFVLVDRITTISYGNGRFLAIGVFGFTGSNGVFSSTDAGRSWQEVDIAPADRATSMYASDFGADKFLAVGDLDSILVADSTLNNWENLETGDNVHAFHSVLVTDSKYILGGDYRDSFDHGLLWWANYLGNPLDWNLVDFSEIGMLSGEFVDLRFEDGIYYALTKATLMQSVDLINWEVLVSVTDESERFSGFEFVGERIFLTSNRGLKRVDQGLADRDRDGLIDTFEQLIIDFDNSDEFDSRLAVAPLGDFDEDGSSNLDEYRSGTDPTDPEDFLSVAGAFNQPILDFITLGETPWIPQISKFLVGGSSLRSTALNDNQESRIELTLPGPISGSFSWSVSSEEGYDFLEFYINGQLRSRISGESDWTTRNFITYSENVVLEWVYKKDFIISAGEDAGWLDDLKITSIDLPVDEDDDSIPDSWELQFYDFADAYAPTDDPNGDGSPILLDYAMNLHPLESSRSKGVLQFGRFDFGSEVWVRFEFCRNILADSLRWELISTDNLGALLEDWEIASTDEGSLIENVVDFDVDGDGLTERVEWWYRVSSPPLEGSEPSSASGQFYKIKVTVD